MGGDFFDFIELPRGGLGFSVADVVGKGIPAALMMVSVRSALRAHAFDVHDVRTTVARVNRHMCRDTLTSEFATVFYGLFDRKQRRLDYVNAGHDPPLVLRGEEVIRLDVGGLVIGIVPEAGFDHGRIEFEPGDRAVFYTDGVVEAANFDGELFGRERLVEALFRYRECGPEELARQILWETRRFSGLSEQTDDISIVTAQIL